MNNLTGAQRLEIAEEQIRDLQESVDFISQCIDLSGFNRVQAGGIQDIPPTVLDEHEKELVKVRAEFDPIIQVAKQFAHCKTTADIDTVMEHFKIVVANKEERDKRRAQELEKFLLHRENKV